MAKIPDYTRGLVLERATPNQVNLGQIEAAGAGMRGAAQVFDVGAQVAQKIKITNDATATNSGVIRRQTEDIDVRQNSQKERRDNPLGYAKEMQPLYKERDKAIMESLPSEEARQAYQSTAEKLNLRNYEEDLNWENKRSVEVAVNKATQSARDLRVLAYEASTPEAFEDIMGQLTRTTSTLSEALAQDERVKFHYQESGELISEFMRGQIEKNPREAKNILADKRYAKMMSHEEKAVFMKAANKSINDQAYTVLDSDNPQQLIKDIDAGVYDGSMDDKEKSEFKAKAVKAFEALDDKAAAQRSIDFAETNAESYNKFIKGELTHADLTKMEQAGQDPEAIEAMRKSMLKRNPVSIEKQQAAIVELAQGYADLKIEKKKGKIKYSGGLEDLVRFQRKVMDAEANGEINKSTASSFINKIVTPLLQKTRQEEGFDDIGWFGDADEPYDVAFQTIQDHLERTGQEQNMPLKAKMLTMAIEEADRLEFEKITDNDEKEKKLKELAKRVLVKYGEIENPVNRTLPDSPNGNIKPDGTVKRNGNFETTLPADAKADSTFKVLEDANGNRARVYYSKSGEVLKVEEM